MKHELEKPNEQKQKTHIGTKTNGKGHALSRKRKKYRHEGRWHSRSSERKTKDQPREKKG